MKRISKTPNVKYDGKSKDSDRCERNIWAKFEHTWPSACSVTNSSASDAQKCRNQNVSDYIPSCRSKPLAPQVL